MTYLLRGIYTMVNVKDSEKTPNRTWHESLTSCQANRTRVGVRTVRRHPAGPGMK